MQWLCISGSWRRVNAVMDKMIREKVAATLAAGDGIIAGGAAGVDYIALQEALRHDPGARRVRIFIPATPERYFDHLRRVGPEGRYTLPEMIEPLIAQLQDLRRRRPAALVGEPAMTEIDQAAYFLRDGAEIAAADALAAYPARTEKGPGKGTWDTVRKAWKKGIAVEVHPFDLTRREG